MAGDFFFYIYILTWQEIECQRHGKRLSSRIMINELLKLIFLSHIAGSLTKAMTNLVPKPHAAGEVHQDMNITSISSILISLYVWIRGAMEMEESIF